MNEHENITIGVIIVKRNVLVRATPQLIKNDCLINPKKYFRLKELFCHRTYLKSSWEKYFEGLQTGQIVPHVKTCPLCSPFDHTFSQGAGQKGSYQKPISEQSQGGGGSVCLLLVSRSLRKPTNPNRTWAKPRLRCLQAWKQLGVTQV